MPSSLLVQPVPFPSLDVLYQWGHWLLWFLSPPLDFEVHVLGIILYMLVCVWLLSLKVMSVKLICVLA